MRNLLILFGLCGAVSASPALFPVVAGDLEARDQTNPLAPSEQQIDDGKLSSSPGDTAKSDRINSEAGSTQPSGSEESDSESVSTQPASSEASTDAEPLKATLTPKDIRETPEITPAPPEPKVKTVPDVVRIITGEASWYGPGFYGNRTASGEIYRPGTMTAAHRTLPFGTKVRVTNLWNGRTAVIRINDRGPFVGHRVIDLGHGAASSLGLTASGIAQVRLEVLR